MSENYLILAVVCIQLIITLILVYNAIKLKNLFPFKETLELEETTIKENEYDNTIYVEAIKLNKGWSKDFQEIIRDTNNYLISNKGAAADFNLIKDISDRTDQKIEKSIAVFVPLPLYIGLLGTMFGIIYGLYKLGGNLSDPVHITFLLSGVKIALFGSMAGLFLTTLNHSLIFRYAKLIRDARKNNYYTFIQVKLMPILSEDMASSLKSIESQLSIFNRAFSFNVKILEDSVSKISINLDKQLEYIKTVEKLGIYQLTKFNVSVFEKLQQSASALEDFNRYFINANDLTKNLNISLNNVTNLYDKINFFHEDIAKILNTIDGKIEDSADFMHFIKSHYSNLENLTDSTKLIISNHENKLLDLGSKYEVFLAEYQEYIRDSILQFTNTLEKDVVETYNSFSKVIENKLIESANSIDDIKQEILGINRTLIKSYDENLKNISEAINLSINNMIRELSSYSANKKFENLKLKIEEVHESIENTNNKQIVNQLEELNKNINKLLSEMNKQLPRRTTFERLFGKK